MVAIAIHPALLVLVAIIAGIYLYYRHKSQRQRRESLLWAGDIDSMTGTEFESMLASIFERLGYNVEHTGSRGDFGADLILSRNGSRIAVQAKRYSQNVGNKAVQEIYSSMPHYRASKGWVVTNSYFTEAAKTQASSCNVRLIDRDELVKAITQARNMHSKK